MRVATLNQQTLLTGSQPKQQSLIAFRPEKDCDSLILNDFQISELCKRMPGLYKIASWTLLYRMSEHGVSLNTFYKRLSTATASLVIMEDENKFKFGAMVHDKWERSNKFYGTSETFVFTFRNTDVMQSWEASGSNDMY
jgi:hypothetical protein